MSKLFKKPNDILTLQDLLENPQHCVPPTVRAVIKARTGALSALESAKLNADLEAIPFRFLGDYNVTTLKTCADIVNVLCPRVSSFRWMNIASSVGLTQEEQRFYSFRSKSFSQQDWNYFNASLLIIALLDAPNYGKAKDAGFISDLVDYRLNQCEEVVTVVFGPAYITSVPSYEAFMVNHEALASLEPKKPNESGR